MRKTYTIVFSNYTFAIFAWQGEPRDNKPFLGNREIIGRVTACCESDALERWRASIKEMNDAAN